MHFTSQEIRETFLNFFKEHDHHIIKGSSIIPKNDPTLLFINSGMAPLKKYFLGAETPPYPRLANVQPCIRTNDIEDVGDRHHLTFFEMLGSWSIGDYYKEKAIELAYDLLVNHFKFPPEKLFATIYEGNSLLNLGPDEEAIRYWEKVGMPSDHIVPKGDDNFWGPAGDTGPCGPCTEVFFDTGDSFGQAYTPGGHFDDVNRYIEIWNAGVFMELNKDKDGHFTLLPMKSVDTGSGIERMYLALNGSNSLYEVDTIQPVFNKVQALLQSDEISDREIRMVTDHIRTCTMLLGEGIVPDKDGRGYIARRLIRKSIACAIRARRSPSELKEVVQEVIVQMSGFYDNLTRNRDNIMSVLHQEINDFTPVIQSGLQMLDDTIQKLNGGILKGESVFDLVTTYGLPLEVISDYVVRKGIAIDKEKYLEEYRKHQEISRAGLKGKAGATSDGMDQENPVEIQLTGLPKTVFTGYDKTEDTGTIVALFKDELPVTQINAGDECLIVFDSTCFYAESGGQVGDTGKAFKPGVSIKITDTQKRKGYFFHTGMVEEGTVSIGNSFKLSVDAGRRIDITKNHTATHLLHAALREVLGHHVVQKGSLVNNEKLRFDFSHNKPLLDTELKEVESRINQWIWKNYIADIKEMDYQSAIDTGAMALFNENYGDRVRVVRFGDVSVELCGGIHVKASGEIGVMLINQEAGVAKGIRRIEAVTGPVAYNQITSSRQILQEASLLLASRSENLVLNIEKLKKNASAKMVAPAVPLQVLFQNEMMIETPEGAQVFIARLDLDSGNVQKAADLKMSSGEADIVYLATVTDGTIKALVTVTGKYQELYKADVLLKNWLEPFGGKGGGKAALAKGGVKEAEKIEELMESLNDVFNVF